MISFHMIYHIISILVMRHLQAASAKNIHGNQQTLYTYVHIVTIYQQNVILLYISICIESTKISFKRSIISIDNIQ